ncbi:FecCD family ABC transporter permease [Agrilactobacillus fermenti]|uniref:FecCD family ABC transporter permease n=1 Tax=Agrilactobacillus fermenti TaxID=2586909 RepID=UPI003A5B9EC5
MITAKKHRFIFWIFILSVFFLGVSLLSMATGEVSLTPLQLGRALLNQSSAQNELILWQFRAPHIVMSIIVGGSLAMSGAVFQRLTNNDLADSSILGINAGASLGAVLFLGLTQLGVSLSQNIWLPVCALIGALLTAGLVFKISQDQSPLRLLLSGVAVGTLLNGLILLIQLQVSQDDFDKVLVWLSGSFWNLDWPYMLILGLIGCLLLPFGLLALHNSDLILLGRRNAMSLGLDYDHKRRQLLIFAIALAGIGVAGGGAISFVGLMAPHIARLLIGNKAKYNLPLTILVGINVLLLADFVASHLFAPSELPVGLVVAMITVPYFIVLMLKTTR